MRRIYNKDAIPTAKDRIHWKVPFWKAAFCFYSFFHSSLENEKQQGSMRTELFLEVYIIIINLDSCLR